jgi:glycogen operon protein
VGDGGYQVGNFPPLWSEWNGKYRDTSRDFWRGQPATLGEFASRLTGSSDLYAGDTRRPVASVNFITCHDGFTLHDLVSYDHKHNEANGEDNRDGHGENYSSNWGVDGPTDDPEILGRRARVQRAIIATVLLANGTPMLLAGDEFGRTQGGNNNAYCQDNEISWIDWTLLHKEPGSSLARFVARLGDIRRSHPVLRSRSFLHGAGEPAPGILDIDWFDQNAGQLSDANWGDGEGRLLTLRRAAAVPDGTVSVLTLMMNSTPADCSFRIPGPSPITLLLDSADPDAPERPLDEETLLVAAHSLVLLHAVVAEKVADGDA